MKIIQWNSAECLGGSELRTLELSEELIRQGDKVFIVCKKNTLFESKVKEKDIPYISYSSTLFGVLKVLLKLFRQKYDIIHVQTGRDYAAAVIVGILTSTPVVIHRRLAAKVSIITQWLINHWRTKIIAVSDVVKQVLISENKFKEDKIKVIHNALPKSRFKVNNNRLKQLEQEFDKKNNKIVISIGNLYPTKGFDEIIEVALRLKKRINNFLILIAGEGEERKKLEKLIEAYNLGTTVKLLGRREDVIELITISNCFVLLSYEEPFGGVFIEAMACGKPIIGYNAGGTPEIVSNAEVGFLVSPHNIDEVEEKLYLLLTDEQLNKKLGENAKKHFEENFDFYKMVNEIKNLYITLTLLGG